MADEKLGFVKEISTAFGNATTLGKSVQIALVGIMGYATLQAAKLAVTGYGEGKKLLLPVDENAHDDQKASFITRTIAGTSAAITPLAAKVLIEAIGNKWLTKGKGR